MTNKMPDTIYVMPLAQGTFNPDERDGTWSDDRKHYLPNQEVTEYIRKDLTEWQPIETAPKDGTEILTVCRGACSVRYWGENDDGDAVWLPRIRGSFPTHWMPLPKPPKGEGA